jgi:hypothetical protein
LAILDVFRPGALVVAYFGLDFQRFRRFSNFPDENGPQTTPPGGLNPADFPRFCAELRSGESNKPRQALQSAMRKSVKALVKQPAMPGSKLAASSSCGADSLGVFSAEIRRLRDDFAKLKCRCNPSSRL